MDIISEVAGLKAGNQPTAKDVADRERAILKEGYDALEAHPNWRDRYRSLTEQMIDAKTDKDRRIAAMTLQMMSRQEEHLEDCKRQFGETTVQASLGPLAPQIMDIVRIFFPNMIVHLVAELQTIPTPNSAILTVKPRYANTAAGVNAGDEIFRNFTNGTYASDIVRASLGTGNASATVFSVTIAPQPVRPGTVKIYNGGVAVGADNGDGAISGNGISAGTVNYGTGQVSVTFSAAPAAGVALSVEHRYDYEQNVDNLRGVDIGLNLVPVNAKPHPMKITWSVAAQLAASAQYRIDIESTVGDLAQQFIRKERDWAVVEKIAAAATAVPDLNFDATVPAGGGLTRKQHFQDWGLKLNRANSYIFNRNQRGMVSFVLCGINASDVIRAQANFVSEPRVVPIGAHKIGTLDGVIDVIMDSSLNPNLYIFGFRGMQLGDAAMIVAEWIPIFLTPIWNSPNLQGQQGIISMYDTFLNNTEYYVSGMLSNYQA